MAYQGSAFFSKTGILIFTLSAAVKIKKPTQRE
ncbi:malate:quinone oxidoreductase [Bacillus sp. NRRL B-14911]|nr:malate:quinone oxidoreductase [Bacillus sp. NRRL B-14911]